MNNAALAAAQGKILELEKEVDDLRATDVKAMTKMYKITDELGQARARIASLTQENMALREKLSAGPCDRPPGAGVSTFLLSTSPEMENDELEEAYDFEEREPVRAPTPKKLVKPSSGGRVPPGDSDSPPSSSSSFSTSSDPDERRRGRSETKKKKN